MSARVQALLAPGAIGRIIRSMPSFDYVLVGGGLQSGLLALALRARQPNTRIALVERAGTLGGNHTWCFHDSDVAPESRPWLEPLVQVRWDGYDVAFPSGTQRIDRPYSCTSTERLHRVVSESVRDHRASELMLDAEVVGMTASTVTLASGTALEAGAVIDARGPAPLGEVRATGYQKFVGLEVELESPHGLARPSLMDANVDQSEGYRFFYVLPLNERTLLLEDTYFHESPVLDQERLLRGIRAYADEHQWRVAEVRRTEHGVLPMPWAGSFRSQVSGPFRAGYRGGWFHPGTGYSFPVAVRVAEFVAGRPPDALFGPELDRFSAKHARQVSLAQFLNRLLFRWYPPERRISIFERFYRLPAQTIRNFYALQLGRRDVVRLLGGRPPRGLSMRYRLRSGPFPKA